MAIIGLQTIREWLGANAPKVAAARSLYAAAVTQSRQAEFYAGYGVPDTLDGRFELLVLHVHLLCRRLARCGPAGGAVAQALFDTMFHDFDRNLREIGVSDPSLPRRIRDMIAAYYGRVGAYEAAHGGGAEGLKIALWRNVYGGRGHDEGAGRLADYVASLGGMMEGAADSDFTGGRFAFAPIASTGAAR